MAARRWVAAPALAACGLFLALAALRRVPALGLGAKYAALTRRSSGGAAIRLASEFGAVAEGYGAWSHVAEIYAVTTLTLVDEAGVPVDGAVDWAIEGRESAPPAAGAASHVFDRLGYHTVGAGGVNASVLVKYVRRSIYALSDEARGRFLDGLKVTYDADGDEGRRRYGGDFVSMAELVGIHLAGAAARECDRWHDDAAFVVKHVALTRLLEASLQAVDARITVPYWDYAADASLDDWTSAAVFHKDVLSPASGNSSDRAVVDGRWAYTRIARARSGAVANAYGLVRSPWNVNPTPYLTRYRYVAGLKDGGYALPSRDAFEAAAAAPTLSVLNSLLNGMLHGEVHIMLGGHWGLDAFPAVTSGNDGFLLSSKMLWRQGVLACPASCAADAGDDCACACPSSNLDEFLAIRGLAENATTAEARAEAVLDAAGVLAFSPLFASGKWLNRGLRTYATLLDLLCAVGTPGEMFTSAAPYDPAFWPLHGLADRALLARRSSSSSFDETWGYAHSLATVASDTHLVCDWTAVDAGDATLPECGTAACEGHRADDLLPFTVDGATFTNAGYYRFMAPDSAAFPYVYDSVA